MVVPHTQRLSFPFTLFTEERNRETTRYINSNNKRVFKLYISNFFIRSELDLSGKDN